MEPIQKGKQANKTSNTCTSDKGKQINKQVEAAHVEAQMQGVVWSCITCRVRYAVCQSTWKSFRDALEMHQKSAEFNTQGRTLTGINILSSSLISQAGIIDPPEIPNILGEFSSKLLAAGAIGFFVNVVFHGYQ